MNADSPIFAGLVLCLLAMPAHAQLLPPQVSPATTADGLLDQAIEQVGAIKAFEAKVRLRVRLFGQNLIGSGEYLQYGTGPATRARLQLQLQLNDNTSSILRVRGEQYLLTQRMHLGKLTTSLIDLDGRVAKATRRAGQGGMPSLPQDWLVIGGMAQYLATLQHNFEFTKPEQTEIDGFPIWAMEGHWNKSVLKKQLAHLSKAIDEDTPQSLQQLPAHLPHRVRLVLGRKSELPLFPHRIEYMRFQEGQGSGKKWESRPTVTVEYYDVGRANINLNMFGTQVDDYDDATDAYIERLKRK